MIIEEHFKETERKILGFRKKEIATWLLNEWYFPEQNILPPSFKVENFQLNNKEYFEDIKNPGKERLLDIKYPKSSLTSRIFNIQHPYHYHDIVYWIMEDRDKILKHLFNKKLKIYSYSFPIPVNRKSPTTFWSPLRSWRLIYEWITMAEKDLVSEAYKYNFIIRTDIANFYNSIYTHSIGRALHWEDKSFKDRRECKLTWSKIDKLVQYANRWRTNGLPIWSALSDLIAEIILSRIDLNISIELKKIKFVATRFKDDYRFLCNSKEDADTILKVLWDELSKFNLLINENKTTILNLPHWLYREHDREYHQHSLKSIKRIQMKKFELTLLSTLDIHRKFGWTSIIDKFLSELLDKDQNLKIVFSGSKKQIEQKVYRTLSLLILLKRESEKVLCYVLSIIELIYIKYRTTFPLKWRIKDLIESEILKANHNKSIFQLTWYVFFAKYLQIWITESWFEKNINKDLRKSPFLESCLYSRQKIFNNTKINLFRTPKKCQDMLLAKRLAVFNKKE